MKRLFALVICFLFLAIPFYTHAAPTKSVAAVDEWAEIAQDAVREGAVYDVSGCYEATLHIYCALSSTTAHTGTEIIVETSSATSGDEDWTPTARFIGPTGTAIKLDLAGDEAAAQTVLSITDPVTNNLDNDGKYKFMEHTGTVADCEIIFQTTNSGDAGDTITVRDGLTNAQTSAAGDIYDIDHATTEAVGMWPVTLGLAAVRVRVTYNNAYDPNGSTVHTCCRVVKTTGL